MWEEAYAKAGLQPLLAGTTGPQAGGWFKKEIKSVEDLKGLKMHAGGFGGEVLKRMGVDAILTPPGEIAAAMASGKLDSVEWKARTSEAMLREIAEQSEFNRRVHDSLMSDRRAAARYAQVSDLAQHQAREMALE